jgi:hypothetical protein
VLRNEVGRRSKPLKWTIASLYISMKLKKLVESENGVGGLRAPRNCLGFQSGRRGGRMIVSRCVDRR